MTNQTKTNYLNYLIDPTFNKVNRLFVLSFENEERRTSFSKYYTLKVEAKEFNVVELWTLMWWKKFFWCASIKKEEAYEKIIYLSKQTELENSELKQQINFIGKPENDRATMFFIIEKSEETTFEFSQNSVSII